MSSTCACGQPRAATCAGCSASLCSEHLTHRQDRDLCFTCAAAVDDQIRRRRAAQPGASHNDRDFAHAEAEAERQARRIDPRVAHALVSASGFAARLDRKRRVGPKRLWADALGQWEQAVADEVRLCSAHAELVGRRRVATVFLTGQHLLVKEMDARGRYEGGPHLALEDVLAAGPLSPARGGEWAVAVDKRYARVGVSPIDVFVLRPRAAKAALLMNGWLLEDLQGLLGDRFGTLMVPAEPARWVTAVQQRVAPEGTIRRERLEVFWKANRQFWSSERPSGFW